MKCGRLFSDILISTFYWRSFSGLEICFSFISKKMICNAELFPIYLLWILDNSIPLSIVKYCLRCDSYALSNFLIKLNSAIDIYSKTNQRTEYIKVSHLFLSPTYLYLLIQSICVWRRHGEWNSGMTNLTDRKNERKDFPPFPKFGNIHSDNVSVIKWIM